MNFKVSIGALIGFVAGTWIYFFMWGDGDTKSFAAGATALAVIIVLYNALDRFVNRG